MSRLEFEATGLGTDREQSLSAPSLSVALTVLLVLGAAYELLLGLTTLLQPYRFPIPYAVPIFDTPFTLVGVGVAYLCLERHRLRQDARSAWLGISLWVTALLALTHILAQPDYPGTPGVDPGVAPYFFFLSYLGAFAGVGLAAHSGDRPFRLTDRARVLVAIGVLALAGLIVVGVIQIKPLLPSLVMKPGRMTPFALWAAATTNGLVAAWALWGAYRKFVAQDRFAGFLLLAGLVWVLGLTGFLIYPYRYAVSWYLAGLARPIGVGLLFVGLLREQVWLYREARARFEELALRARHDAALQDFGRRLLEATTEDGILDGTARATADILGADRVALFMLEGTPPSPRLRTSVGWDAPVGDELPAKSLAARALASRATAEVEDFATSAELARPVGVESGVAVPLAARDQPIGVLTAYFVTAHRSTDEERRVVATLAHQAALALANVRLYTELERNLDRLKETQAQLIQADKLTALGTLLSGMAHELNNPLSTIQLSVQLMKRQPLPELVMKRLNTVDDECERASRIIRDLLVFARRRAPERQPIDVNKVLGDALTLQMPEMDLHRIRVVTALGAAPRIMGDAHQLQQVFLNLFANARHAMKAAHGTGTLTVRSIASDHEVLVEVEDDGPGIPAEHLGRIFDPFFTTKGAGEGTGLGLSLSIGIVEAHGGRMTAENLPDVGARFQIRLPADAVEDATVSEVAPSVARRTGRVLVVDDEDNLRAALVEVLTMLGHEVTQAATGQETLARLVEGSFDVVTLDLRLPDLDGKAVWQRILARDPQLAARVIFMTGDTMSPETQKFLEEAGRPVLTKPLRIDRVSQLVDEILAS